MDAMDTVCFRTVSMEWNVPEKYGPHAVLFFFLIQKKPAIVPNSDAFNSFIGDGSQGPELKGDSESSDGYQAGNVINEALHVIGLHGSGDHLSLPAGLGVRKGGTDRNKSLWRGFRIANVGQPGRVGV